MCCPSCSETGVLSHFLAQVAWRRIVDIWLVLRRDQKSSRRVTSKPFRFLYQLSNQLFKIEDRLLKYELLWNEK